MDVLHSAVWVSDLEATSAFYCEGIGLEYARDFTSDGVTNYFVTGQSDAEIQFKHDPDRDPPDHGDGFGHLAVGVDDTAATVDRLADDWGTEVVKPPTVLEDTGSTIAFVTDPDGYVVELVQHA